jgi:hypothetical protein
MRWQVSLQLAIGLGALFGLAYYGVDRFIGPPLESNAVDAADAYAIVGASEIATSWERARSGRRALVRALAGSPTFREGSSDLIEAALESAAVQMGGGAAALVRSKEKIGSFGEAPGDLAELEAAADAQRGVAIVRFERIGEVLYAVSAAPVPQSDGRVLVLASKLDENELRLWIRGLPDHVSVVLLDGDRMLASTVVPQHKKSIAPPFTEEIRVAKQRFRTARRTLSDDAGTKLEVVGLAAVRSVVGSAVVERTQLLVISLGALALILALVLVLIAPSESVRELIEEFNQASRDLPRVSDTQPLAPDLPPEPSLPPAHSYFTAPPPAPPPPAPPRARDRIPESPPLAPPAPSFSSPGLEAVTQPAKRDRPSSDTRLALDAEQRIQKPIQKPPPPVPPPSRSSPGGIPFGAPDPIPLPGTAPARTNNTIPPASPFDQIAAAAFAPPMAPPSPPSSIPRLGPKEGDLLMPKGVDLDTIAREAAKQGPPKHEPSDLPGLRAPFPSQSGISPLSQHASMPPSRQREDLPGLRANDPAARAFDRSPSNPTSPPRKSSDPWSNPSIGLYSTTPPVQERLSVPDRDRAPSNPPPKASPAPAGAPVAYDEEHYRVVYNDFVSSKARLGEAVDNITYEGFRSKLRSSEEALINRHGCRAVRFQVLVKDNTVSLRPQLVR